MAATDQDFTIWEGDDEQLLFTTDDGSGNPYNLAGASIEWAMSLNAVSAPIVTKSTGGGGITINNPPTAGKFTVTLADADTAGKPGTYYHEARVTDSNGDSRVIATGTATINASNI